MHCSNCRYCWLCTIIVCDCCETRLNLMPTVYSLLDWCVSIWCKSCWSKSAAGLFSDLPLPPCLNMINLFHLAWAESVRSVGSCEGAAQVLVHPAPSGALKPHYLPEIELCIKVLVIFFLRRKKREMCLEGYFASAAGRSVHIGRDGFSWSFPRLPVKLHPQFIIGDVLCFPSFSVSLHHLSSSLPISSLISSQTQAEVSLYAIWSCLTEDLTRLWSE